MTEDFIIEAAMSAICEKLGIAPELPPVAAVKYYKLTDLPLILWYSSHWRPTVKKADLVAEYNRLTGQEVTQRHFNNKTRAFEIEREAVLLAESRATKN